MDVEHDRLGITAHTLLRVGNQPDCDVEFIFRQIVIACLRCGTPDIFKLVNRQARSLEEGHSVAASKFVRVALTGHAKEVAVVATLLVVELEFERDAGSRRAGDLIHYY